MHLEIQTILIKKLQVKKKKYLIEYELEADKIIDINELCRYTLYKLLLLTSSLRGIAYIFNNHKNTFEWLTDYSYKDYPIKINGLNKEDRQITKEEFTETKLAIESVLEANDDELPWQKYYILAIPVHVKNDVKFLLEFISEVEINNESKALMFEVCKKLESTLSRRV